jgi:hypothetical protein
MAHPDIHESRVVAVDVNGWFQKDGIAVFSRGVDPNGVTRTSAVGAAPVRCEGPDTGDKPLAIVEDVAVHERAADVRFGNMLLRATHVEEVLDEWISDTSTSRRNIVITPPVRDYWTGLAAMVEAEAVCDKKTRIEELR